MRGKDNKNAKRTIHCAIYTRKSSEEGLDQEFNSLDAQREAAEAYIASQKAEGWTTLPDRYDDGGYSGGSMDRPALDQLLRDIDQGRVDCVVVYKVDRLSRSLLDFARIMERFDNHGVSFVSVTQHFNTTHSMGRLTLNILLSFAQFEREIIGERIRDKKSAQARKGKWIGGVPVLGYDVDRSGPSPHLVVNPQEATRVREIFRMYLQEGSLLLVVKELNRRGWLNKQRITTKGKQVGGSPFNKTALHELLTNPLYTGMMPYKDELHRGEHEAIVDQELFEKVQHQLKHNGRTGGVEVRNKYGALLRGLLRCKSCGTAMSHTFCTKNKRISYRYYRCVHAMKNGHNTCPTGSLPAGEIERLVVEEIHGLANDETLLTDVMANAQAAMDSEAAKARHERDELRKERNRNHAELQRLATSGKSSADVTARIASIHQQLLNTDQRLSQLDTQVAELESRVVTPQEARAAFADFDGLWTTLSPREQARLVKLLIEKVEYDGEASTVSVTFRPTSIRSLINRNIEEAA